MGAAAVLTERGWAPAVAAAHQVMMPASTVHTLSEGPRATSTKLPQEPSAVRRPLPKRGQGLGRWEGLGKRTRQETGTRGRAA